MKKIRKCLALGKSSNSNEAAVALGQAQKLMKQFGLSESDIGDHTLQSVRWDCPWQSSEVNLWMSNMAAVIAKVFAIEILFVTDQKRFYSGRLRGYMVWEFLGPAGRVQLATYTANVLWRAMEKDWDRHRETEKERMKNRYGSDLLIFNREDFKDIFEHATGDQYSFRVGWMEGVYRNVVELAPTELERESMQNELKRRGIGQLPEDAINHHALDPLSLRSGHRAGSEMKLARPMDTDRNKLGKL